MNQALAGLITGILFGILLQRTGVLRYDKQVGAVRLLDLTIMKFMLSAIFTGMLGVFLLRGMGLLELDVKATVLGTNIIGGLIFGLGWGILGYCPGTAAGALGEGRIDALWGILGMVAGSWFFAEFYPLTQSGIFAAGDFGKISLVDTAGLPPLAVVLLAAVIILGTLWLVDRMDPGKLLGR